MTEQSTPALIIYGSSDDLIEIEGAISEEFTPRHGDTLIAVSDGTLLRVRYDTVWRISPIRRGVADLTIVQATEDDDDNYSDKATLTGAAFSWVALGSEHVTAKG